VSNDLDYRWIQIICNILPKFVASEEKVKFYISCVFQKYLEMEDENEEWKKDNEEKIESLESLVRMMELKNKNASDHCKL